MLSFDFNFTFTSSLVASSSLVIRVSIVNVRARYLIETKCIPTFRQQIFNH